MSKVAKKIKKVEEELSSLQVKLLEVKQDVPVKAKAWYARAWEKVQGWKHTVVGWFSLAVLTPLSAMGGVDWSSIFGFMFKSDTAKAAFATAIVGGVILLLGYLTKRSDNVADGS